MPRYDIDCIKADDLYTNQTFHGYPTVDLYAKVDKIKKLKDREKSTKSRENDSNSFDMFKDGGEPRNFLEPDKPSDPPCQTKLDLQNLKNIQTLEGLKREMIDSDYRGGRKYHCLPPVCGRSPPCNCPQDQVFAAKLRLRKQKMWKITIDLFLYLHKTCESFGNFCFRDIQNSTPISE